VSITSPALGADVAEQAHADAVLGDDQADAIGVHAAKQRGVDADGGQRARTRGSDRSIVVAEVVRATDDEEVPGVICPVT